MDFSQHLGDFLHHTLATLADQVKLTRFCWDWVDISPQEYKMILRFEEFMHLLCGGNKSKRNSLGFFWQSVESNQWVECGLFVVSPKYPNKRLSTVHFLSSSHISKRRGHVPLTDYLILFGCWLSSSMCFFSTPDTWGKWIQVDFCIFFQMGWLNQPPTSYGRIPTWWFQAFFIHPDLGKISNLTNIFQRGWNHQPDTDRRDEKRTEILGNTWLPEIVQTRMEFWSFLET